MEKKELRFAVKLALPGMLAGVAIAVGVPYVVLAHGPQLSGVVHTILIICSLLLGSLVALVAVFFGTVIPKEMSKETTTPGRPEGQTPAQGKAPVEGQAPVEGERPVEGQAPEQ